MKKKWNNDLILSELEKWITEGKWKGIGHLQKDYPSLATQMQLRGVEKTFKELELNYNDFKVKGKVKKKSYKFNGEYRMENIIRDLKEIIETKVWIDIQWFSKQYPSLYNAIKNTIGLEEAFSRIGLDYSNPKWRKVSKFNSTKTLLELAIWINEGKWYGENDLEYKYYTLYKNIQRQFGFKKAFEKIGLNYDNYKVIN